jgi:hypothetical protein
MRWLSVVLAGLALGGSALGCTTVLGIDGSYSDAFDSGISAAAGVGGVAGTGGNGTAGGGGTAAVAGNETCDNAQDDDGDGKADCADPDCAGAGFQCVPQPPVGWVGPVRLESGTSCSGAWAKEHVAGGLEVTVPTGGSCPTCSCEKALGVTCGIDLLVYDQSNCAGPSHSKKLVSNGVCQYVSDASAKSAKADGPIRVNGGACAGKPSGAASVPVATWKTEARTCQPSSPAAGCSSTQNCAPPTGTGGACVAKVGDASCPSPYTEKQMFFRAIDDQRKCSACACNLPTSKCLAAELSLQDPLGSSCSSGGSLITTSCQPVILHPTENTYKVETWSAFTTDATCTPIASTIQGSAVPQDPVTVCCMP